MYADDTSIITPFIISPDSYLTMTHVTDLINLQLNNIFLWLSANKLSLNINKTKYMVFHFKQKKLENFDVPKLNIDGNLLTHVRNYKFLGLMLDDTISWDSHINHISNKISKVNAMLSKLKYQFPSHVLLMIYNSLILSQINYGLTLWTFGNCERIKRLQKQALRNINKSHFLAHTQPICKTLKTLLFDDISNLQCLKFYYKLQNKLLPKYFYDSTFLSKTNLNKAKYSFRQNTQCNFPNYVIEVTQFRPEFIIPITKKHASENRLYCYLPKLLNISKFPDCIIDKIYTHSLQGFSKYFKTYIINQYQIQCYIPNCFSCTIFQ